MRAIFRIINIGYWKSIFAPIITFLFPPFYLFIVGSAFYFTPFGGAAPVSLSSLIMPCAFLLTPTIIMLVMFPQALYELNDSVLIRYLKATSIKKTTVLFSAFLYYAFFAFVSYFLGALLNPVLSVNKGLHVIMLELFNGANWGSVFYTIFIHIILTGSIAIFIVSIAKKPIVVPLLGFSILVASLILAGFIVPIQIASWENHPLWAITYLDPLRYTSFLSYESWFGTASQFNTYQSSIFNVSSPYMARLIAQLAMPVTILNVSDKIANIFVPYAFSIVFISASLVLYRI